MACFSRIATFADPRRPKKSGKKSPIKRADEGSPEITLFADASCTTPIPGNVPNKDAWPAAAVLRIGETPYTISYNPPTVTSLHVFTAPLAGHALLAIVKLQSCELADCKWEWRSVVDAPAELTVEGVKKVIDASVDAEVVGRERFYVPREADVGARLRVTCIPCVADGVCGVPVTALSGAHTETVLKCHNSNNWCFACSVVRGERP
jgi:hypothetical protein